MTDTNKQNWLLVVVGNTYHSMVPENRREANGFKEIVAGEPPDKLHNTSTDSHTGRLESQQTNNNSPRRACNF